MIIKAEKYSAEELMKVDAANVTVVSIETSIEKEKAAIVKDLLQINEEVRVVLIVDPEESETTGRYSNLAIVEAIGELKHLAVLAFGSIPLKEIKLLSCLKNLVSFRLTGNYKKDIDLNPLANATEIEELELEYGIAGAGQVTFVNNLPLKSLKVSVLDLKRALLNPRLEQLTITNTLKNPELLAEALPALTSFTLNHAKGINSFKFLAPLKGLQSLQIAHTSKFTSIPKMDTPAELKSLSLVNTKQFDDLKSILQFEQLEELKITEPMQVPLAEFSKLADLKSLKKVYAVFKTDMEDDNFGQMAQKNGWLPI